MEKKTRMSWLQRFFIETWLASPTIKVMLKNDQMQSYESDKTQAEMMKRISGTIGTFCENYQESREGIAFSQNKIKHCSQ